MTTRRHAEDPGRVGPEEADALSGETFQAVEVEALGGEDPPLHLGAAHRVLADVPVAADNAMAWDEERNGVVAERRTHGADRLRAADLGGDPAVRPNLAGRDLQRLAQDGLLERRAAAKVHGDRGGPIAGETAAHGATEPRRQGIDAVDRSLVVALELGFEVGRVAGEGDGRHAASVEGHEHGSRRRVDRGIGVGQADGPERLRQQ